MLENQGHGVCDLVFSRDGLYFGLLERQKRGSQANK